MSKKSILILGGNGFSGAHFTKFLLSMGNKIDYKIISVDIKFIDTNCFKNVEYHEIDLSEKDILFKFLNDIKPAVIVNFIGILRSKNFDNFYKINVSISQILFEFAKHNSVEKILVIGSAAEYGIPEKNPVVETDDLNPINYYGLSKVLQTKIAKYYANNFNVPVIIARTFNLLGEGISRDLAIGNWRFLIHNALDNDIIKFGNLESSRDYLTVEEVVMYYWKLILYGIPGEVYNVCSGKPVKMRYLLEKMIEESGKKIKIEIDSALFKKDDLPIIFGNNGKLLKLIKNKSYI